MSKKSSIEVAIRVRPLRVELSEAKSVWEITSNSMREKANSDSSFAFERIFNMNSNTVDMYTTSVRDSIVKNVAQGYNGTVMAYGQTGSGKSFTMLGDGLQGNNEGIVSMAIKDLFLAVEKEKTSATPHTVQVFVTMLEIYNETLRDLLSPPGSVTLPLSIRENEHGVYVHNAIKRPVKNAKETLNIIHNEAEARRVSAATAMNERSSRSHCLIRIHVEKTVQIKQNDDDDDDDDDASDTEEDAAAGGVMQKKIVSSLNLVDLAGSERVAKTGATGLRMVEGGHINKSLTILTTVINRLTEAGKKGAMTHVPYRDSKLTHLLKTAIGGNSFTTVFCCVTAAEQHMDESRSTLQFATRAKTIKNEVSMNEVADPKTKIRELEIEVKRLRRTILAMDIYLWSKKLKIKLLQERRNAGEGETAMSPLRGGGGGGGGAGFSSGGGHGGAAGIDGAQLDQLQMIVEQLTQQNDDLQQQLSDLRASGGIGGGGGGLGYVDPMFGIADDDEKRRLRIANGDLERQLKDAQQERDGLQASLDELDAMCRELEDENSDKCSELSDVQQRVKALEAQLASSQMSERNLQTRIDQLLANARQEEQRMLERARGDDMLEQLTKLHVEHQTLQFEHNTLLDMFSRNEIEKAAEVGMLQDRLADMSKQVEDTRQQMLLQNSYLWRLMSAASMVTHGKPVDPADTTSTVREHHVESAVKALTSFVSSRANRPPGVCASDGTSVDEAGQQQQQSQSQSPLGATRPSVVVEPTTPVPGLTSDVTSLQKKVRDLEAQLVQKDAQRDIIIDTKLKRMQELVLRMHSTNTWLKKEIQTVVDENHQLHEIMKKEPKLLHKLNKTSLKPASEADALNRAQFAPTPQRPFGHN